VHTGSLRRVARADSRLPQIPDAAARLFCTQGWQGTTMRDIAQIVGILPGPLSCHFTTKDDLLAAPYARGVAPICEAVDAAVARSTERWRGLEAACVAHLQAIWGDDDPARMVVRVQPADVPNAAKRSLDECIRYEALWVALIKALPLPPGTERKALRLLSLGALNRAPKWYRADGVAPPRALACQFIAMLQHHE
jgi:AcrR family transcriptional regulator